MPPPPLTPETQSLLDAYAALNRGDIPAFLAPCHPDIEWIEPPEISGGTTLRGLDPIKAHISQARAAWAEGGCHPERTLTAGNHILLFIHIKVRLHHETHWREARIIDAFTFHNGKATHKRTFTNPEEALQYAGIPGPVFPLPGATG